MNALAPSPPLALHGLLPETLTPRLHMAQLQFTLVMSDGTGWAVTVELRAKDASLPSPAMLDALKCRMLDAASCIDAGSADMPALAMRLYAQAAARADVSQVSLVLERQQLDGSRIAYRFATDAPAGR